MNLKRSWCALLLGLLTVAVYLNSLSNQFVWDDEFLITNNSSIRNHTYLGAIFTTDLYHYTADHGTLYYRPLQALSDMLDYALWGLNPWGYHCTSILLHVGCVLLIWLLIQQVSSQNWVALFVAALFAVHPVNTNAVTYIAGRADPLALACLLGALWLFRKRRQGASHLGYLSCYCGAVLLFVAALFSRESAMIFPALVFLDTLTFAPDPHHRFRRACAASGPFLLLLGAFLLWRHAVLAQVQRSWLPDLSLSPQLSWQIPFRVLATDCGLLLWPAHLHMERQVVFGGRELLALTGCGVLLAVGLLWTLRRTDRIQPLTFFGVGWFCLTLLPTLAIPTIAVSAAEHWLYVPSIGFYLAFVAPVCQQLNPLAPRYRMLASAFGVVVLGALAARTIRRNCDWADPVTLYSQTEQAAPYSSRVWNNLGREYLARGETQRALTELRAAEHAGWDNGAPQSNLADLYLATGDLDHAQATAAEILRQDPEHIGARLQLAAIAEQRGEFAQTEREFRRAIAATPDLGPRLRFGQFLLRRGRAAPARQVATEMCDLDPGNAPAHNLLGVALAELGDLDGAAAAFEKAAALDRHSPDAWLNLGRLAFRHNHSSVAVTAFRHALQIQPDNGPAHFQLGTVFWKLGDRPQAEAELAAAAQALPGNATVRAALVAVRAGQPFVP